MGSVCAALCRWPVWEFANRTHITQACSEALWESWFSGLVSPIVVQ